MKKILVCLLALFMILSLVACSNDTKSNHDETTSETISEQDKETSTPTIDESTESDESENQNVDESKPDDSNPDESETIDETQSDESKPNEEESKPSEDEELTTDDWKDLTIKIEGKVFKFPYSYTDLKQFGYDFDLADYGYDDGYILNPRDKISGTIKLENPDLDKYDCATVYIGFANFSDKAKDILECDLWNISINNQFGTNKLVKDKLEFELAKGIKSGSTIEEITTTYGEPDETYDAETYVVLTYYHEYTEYMRLTVNNEYGLVGVELKSY